ncbi:RagB/SusD family nutrient uptake outer membrane protein [Lewinella sp. 4G2]|uniref:RagB/SusD family nutrient uptake outer membrane protein n=1 Tax=Lewinella sp. 4G2 TaxID=1803372 RepID=UPI0007B46644|nr:RagB/SusD family nutrient uptake outer membrane protein [Lewinella sp. 4G2]OAV43990.1 hypothetical protein A3850_005545 [Lewinella sp. 4G2]
MLALLLCLAACDDFLDVDSPNDISRAELFETVRGANAAVAGLYLGLGDGAYYQFRFPIYADLPGNLKLPSQSGGSLGSSTGTQRGLQALRMRTITPALDQTNLSGFYQNAYEVIFQASDILDGLANVTDGAPGEVASLAAEARAIRALVHFDLVRLFAQAPGFTENASHEGIVIIDDLPGIFDLPARRSVAESYAAILADLDIARADLDATFSRRSNEPIWLTPAVVDGLIARVSAYVGDWETVAAAAGRAITASGLALTPAEQYVDGWAEGGLSEILWELDLQRLVEDGEDVNFQSPALIVGAGNPLPLMEISEDLLNEFAPEDLRRELFIPNEDGVMLSGKWPFAVNEIRNPPLLRLSELYLLRAEANVELSNLAAATEDYLAVHGRSVANPTVPTDLAALRLAIRQERRRELALEGHHFFDLGRWGESLVREDCLPEIEGDCILSYPDFRFVLPLPFDATRRNPNLSQNPGY